MGTGAWNLGSEMLAQELDMECTVGRPAWDDPDPSAGETEPTRSFPTKVTGVACTWRPSRASLDQLEVGRREQGRWHGTLVDESGELDGMEKGDLVKVTDTASDSALVGKYLEVQQAHRPRGHHFEVEADELAEDHDAVAEDVLA